MQQNIVNSPESTDITDWIGILVDIYHIQCGISQCCKSVSHYYHINECKTYAKWTIQSVFYLQMYKTSQHEVATWS